MVRVSSEDPPLKCGGRPAPALPTHRERALHLAAMGAGGGPAGNMTGSSKIHPPLGPFARSVQINKLIRVEQRVTEVDQGCLLRLMYFSRVNSATEEVEVMRTMIALLLLQEGQR